MKRTALALTLILALLISAIAGMTTASSQNGTNNQSNAVPTISIVYPTDETFFNVSIVGVYFNVQYQTNDTLSWVGCSIDGGSNVTVTGNSTDEQEWMNAEYQFEHSGYNTLTLYANDTDGNWATPQTVTYLVNYYPDSTPPPKPTPTLPTAPTIFVTNVNATSTSGAVVALVVNGNITNDQMSNVVIATNQSASTTTVSFTVTGESGTTGFGNVTIPKSAVSYGTTPTIYIDGQPAPNQGFTQDSNNYYVWFTTSFSTHQISIVFTTTSTPSPTPSAPEFPTWVILPLFAIVILLSIIFIRKRMPKK